MIKFDFSTIPIPLSEKVVEYICPKCKVEFKEPLEMVLEFEQEDAFNGLPISTPPYTICPKCKYNKCVPLDYKSKRGYHHKYNKYHFILFIHIFMNLFGVEFYPLLLCSL